MNGQAGSFDEYGAWDPMVLKDGNTYKMWYVATSSCTEEGCLDQVGYAESKAYQGPALMIDAVSITALNRSPSNGGPQLMFNVIPEGPSPIDMNALYVEGPNGFFRPFNESEIRDVVGEQFVSGASNVASFPSSYNGTYTFWLTANNGGSVSKSVNFIVPSSLIAYPVDGTSGLDRRIVMGGPEQSGATEYINGATPTFKWKPYLGSSYYYRVRVWDMKQPNRLRCWYQSLFTMGTTVDGSGFMTATVPDGALKTNSNYFWEIEVSTTDQFWTTSHISRSDPYAFYTAAKGSDPLPNGSASIFSNRSFYAGDQTTFVARVTGLARWDIKPTPTPFRVLESDVTPYRTFVLNNSQGNDMRYFVQQPEPADDYGAGTPGIAPSTYYSFYISDGSSSDMQIVNFVYNAGVPQVTKDEMVPSDNSYLNTLEPKFKWKSKGAGYYHRLRVVSWNGLNIYESTWQNGTAETLEMSADVPTGFLQSGVYRWWVEVADTDSGSVMNRTQSQRLTFVAGAPTGTSLKDELVLNFGPTYGLWHYDQTGGWKQWNTVNPSQMVTVDLNGDGTDELVAAFPGYGLYTYDSTNGWQQINTVIPEVMGAGRNGIACDYGATYGLWLWNLTNGWEQINTVKPDKMIAADIDNDGQDELIAGFNGYGLYVWDDPGVWTQINTVVPDAMIRAGTGIACDYGATYGLWHYEQANGWQQLNTVDPGLMLAVDIDNDGVEEGVIAFAGYGLYTYEPATNTWTQINTVIPDAMIRAGDGVVCDYGVAYGLWSWSIGGGWQQLNTVDPGQMTVVDIDKDGLEELVVSFSGYGLYYFHQTTGWHLLNDVLPVDFKPINFYP